MRYLISNKNKLLIGTNPRVGSGTIKSWFARLEGQKIAVNVHKEVNLHKNIDIDISDYYKVVVLRNPFYRLVSSFIGIFVNKNRTGLGFKDFEGFVNHLYRRHLKNKTFYSHLIPQTGEGFQDLDWDKVVDLEDLNSCLKDLSYKFKIPKYQIEEIGKTYKSKTFYQGAYLFDYEQIKRLEPSYESYYTECLYQKVCEIYKKDFNYYEEKI